MPDLLNTDDALRQILENIPEAKSEIITIDHALGRVLATEIYAPIDLPSFPNSAMDGFAVRSDDLKIIPVTLKVVMDIPAGKAPEQTLKQGEAARIMTGAPVPDGADTVVPVEDTNITWEAGGDIELLPTVIIEQTHSTGSNIRQKGESIRRGDSVLRSGIRLRPQDIGMLVGLGIGELTVFSRPRVLILSTGDELVEVNDPLEPGKIRDTNSYTIAGLVTNHGGEAIRIPAAKDTLEDVRQLFEKALSYEPDVIVSTAGVSVGTYDVVRNVLDEIGNIGFWRVNVRPGKPLAFGQIQGVPFFGLPGNPVSAMITFDLFVRPVILKLGGRVDDAEMTTAIVADDMTSDGRQTYVRVKLKNENGEWYATTTGTQSSGALMSMVVADGLLIIPENVKFVPKGSKLTVRLLRN